MPRKFISFLVLAIILSVCAPALTPTLTPVPMYSAERLSEMTNEQKFAAAPRVESAPARRGVSTVPTDCSG